MREFTSKDITVIMKEGRRSGVKSLKVGDLEITFCDLSEPVIAKIDTHLMPPQHERINLEHPEESSNIEAEIAKEQDLLDDPNAYEERMIDEA